MTYTEGLRQGAAHMHRTAEKNPERLLMSMMEDDPTASADTLFNQWKDKILADDDYLLPTLRHAFRNMMTNIERGARNRELPDRKTRQQKAAEAEKRAEALKQRIENIVLMNLMTPYGKFVRDLTFAEMGKLGGWYGRVAKKGKPNQIVGKVLTEHQLRAIS